MHRHSPADPTLPKLARQSAWLERKAEIGQPVNLARLFDRAPATVTSLPHRPARIARDDTAGRRTVIENLRRAWGMTGQPEGAA